MAYIWRSKQAKGHKKMRDTKIGREKIKGVNGQGQR